MQAENPIDGAEAMVGEGLTSVPGTLGTLGKKLMSGARSAISHIPVIGKYASSGNDGTTTEAPEPSTGADEASEEPAKPEESGEQSAPEKTEEPTTTPAAAAEESADKPADEPANEATEAPQDPTTTVADASE